MVENPAGKVIVKQNDQKENQKKGPANEQHARPRSLSAQPTAFDFTFSCVHLRLSLGFLPRGEGPGRS